MATLIGGTTGCHLYSNSTTTIASDSNAWTIWTGSATNDHTWTIWIGLATNDHTWTNWNSGTGMDGQESGTIVFEAPSAPAMTPEEIRRHRLEDARQIRSFQYDDGKQSQLFCIRRKRQLFLGS